MSSQMIVRDFHGNAINQRASDNYLDATAMCQATGKQWNDYYRLENTRAFLNALSTETGYPVSEQNQGLIQVRKGGNDLSVQGTWVHPHVSINLAQWCSPEFAVQVSKWVLELMTTGKTELPGYRSEIDYAVMAKITTTARKTYSGLGLTGEALNKAVRTALIEKTGIDLLAGIVKDEIIDDAEDIWQDAIDDYLNLKDECTIQTILTDGLKMDLDRCDKMARNRVANVLRALSWKQSSHVMLDGKRKRGWKRP